jgi:lipopolysaccharide export system ATP-binding protein
MTMGLIPPDEGRVLFNKDDITRLPMYRRARKGIGYLSQETSVFRNLTVEENLLAILETRKLGVVERRRRAERSLGEMGLLKLRKNKAGTLSGGERRRLEIARALLTEPFLILLDEPLSGLDPITVSEIQDVILNLKSRGMGVLLTDHAVREILAVTDRSYIINEGKILTGGTSSELLQDAKARKFYLGDRFRADELQQPS